MFSFSKYERFLKEHSLYCLWVKTRNDGLFSTIPRPNGFKYFMGDKLTKKSGSNWTGNVVGFYSNKLTPEGYAIESDTEKGSVQIYPEKALTKVT